MAAVARRAALLAVALALAFAVAAARTDTTGTIARPPVAFLNVTVVDVERGVAIPDRVVIVDKGVIQAIAPAAAVKLSSMVRVIEGRGKFLIPGLWDMHVHALWDTTVARNFLAQCVVNGVTGVRDMGGTIPVLQAANQRIADGEWLAPRLVAAGVVLDGPEPVSPEISWPIADAAAARAAVDSLAALGAHFIKVYTLLPRAAYFAAIARAHERGLAVAGHLPFEVSPGEAARAGQRSIEHLRDELGPLCAGLDTAACGRLLDSLCAGPVWQTPTLVVLAGKSRTDSSVFRDPRFARLPAVVRADWTAQWARRRSDKPAVLADRRARFAHEHKLVRAMSRRGVPLLAGTDAGVPFAYPGSGLHDELEALVRAGLTPREALAAATLEPARYLNATREYGRIASGLRGDLVLLDANPLADIRNLRKIQGVLLNGYWFDRAALDQARRDVE